MTYTVDTLTPESRDKMEAVVKAAIPVAELEHQAVELLKERPFCSTDERDWYKKVRDFLTQVKALQ